VIDGVDQIKEITLLSFRRKSDWLEGIRAKTRKKAGDRWGINLKAPTKTKPQ
jgi:hypothetical protein